MRKTCHEYKRCESIALSKNRAAPPIEHRRHDHDRSTNSLQVFFVGLTPRELSGEGGGAPFEGGDRSLEILVGQRGLPGYRLFLAPTTPRTHSA